MAKKKNESNDNRNLITGIIILLLIGLFTINYFSNRETTETLELEEVSNNIDGPVINVFGELEEMDAEEETSVETTSDRIVLDVPLEFDDSQLNDEGMVEVLGGESLWNVAERVCGHGERYTYMAEANGYSIWWAPLQPGQMLTVDCGE